jgi:RNA polymerase sigma-B factor
MTLTLNDHSVPLLPAPVAPDASPAEETARERRSRSTAELLAEASATTDDAERSRLHEEIVRLNMGVAESVAARYRRRGVPDDDLTQVAYLGLVKAVQGFDASFDRDFLSYAVPTMRGEVRRYFRDHGWAVRPPRRIQELQARIAGVSDELSAMFGRSPRPKEVAAFLDVEEDEVIEALSAKGCFSPSSLDRPAAEGSSTSVGELMGHHDAGPDAAEARVVLAPVMHVLSERDRRIIYLRFFHGRTQSEIAEDIGVTQMQVSRLLARILKDLRAALED